MSRRWTNASTRATLMLAVASTTACITIVQPPAPGAVGPGADATVSAAPSPPGGGPGAFPAVGRPTAGPATPEPGATPPGLVAGAVKVPTSHPPGLTPVVTRLRLDAPPGADAPTTPSHGDIFLAPIAKGGSWLLWNTGLYDDGTQDPPPPWGTRIMRLDADFGPTGGSVAGPAGLTFTAVAPMADGGFAAIGHGRKKIAGQWWPHEAWYLRFDAAGRQVARYLMFGHDERGPGASFYPYSLLGALAESDGKVAVYLGQERNLASPGEPDSIHEGDAYFVFGPDHQPIAELADEWQASHSSLMQVVPGPRPGTFWQLTQGDAGPFGLLFTNRETKAAKVVWAPPAAAGTSSIDWDLGYLGGFHRIGELGYAFLAGSKVARPPERSIYSELAPLLVVFDGAGSAVRERWFDEPGFGQDMAHITPLGDGRLLLAWGSGSLSNRADQPDIGVNYPTKFAIYDPRADRLDVAPTAIDLPMLRLYSRPVSLPDGGVAWGDCRDPDLSEVTLVRVYGDDR